MVIGFINLNKPSGWTSHDCVAKVRRLLKIKRVGHGGTLDPLARGVLPIAVGSSTRLLSYLPENKAYQARIRFGVTTNTDDLEGEILQTQSAAHLSLEQIEAILPQFIGEIAQVPPAYSAIQKDGKRLYELARKGEIVEVPTRKVNVYGIECLGWYPGEFPELEVAIACGPGTYIRAIARDWGNRLNVGATLAALIRTESCGMQLRESITLEELERQLQEGTFSLIEPDILLQHLTAITLSDVEAKKWCQGQKITVNSEQLSLNSEFPPLTPYVRIQEAGGQLLGIGELVNSTTDPVLIPKLVLNNDYSQLNSKYLSRKELKFLANT